MIRSALLRRRAIAAVALAALALAACGDDGDETTTAGDPASEEATDDGTTSDGDEPGDGDAAGDAATSGGHPCEVVTDDLLAELFPGADFESRRLRGQHTVNEVEWRPDTCKWDSETFEVKVSTAGPDGFDGGFVCAETKGGMGYELEVVEGLGDEARWLYDDFNGPNGALEVCEGELRIDVDIDAPNGTEADPAELRDAAVAIAETLL